MKTLTKAAIALPIVAVALIVGTMQYQKSKDEGPTVPAFEPSVQNDKTIDVLGWSRPELEKILKGFSGMYDEQLHPEFNFLIRTTEPAVHRVIFPKDIQPDLYCFLVNYIEYPMGFDLTGRTISVVGTATLSKDFALPDPALLGRRATFYVPTKDTDYDNVHVWLEPGLVYRNSFAAPQWQKVDDPRLPEDVRPPEPR